MQTTDVELHNIMMRQELKRKAKSLTATKEESISVGCLLLLFTCTCAYRIFKSRQQQLPRQIRAAGGENDANSRFTLALHSDRCVVPCSAVVGPTHSTTTTVQKSTNTHAQRYEERMRDADNNKQTDNRVTARSVMCFRSNSFDYFHLSSRKI